MTKRCYPFEQSHCQQLKYHISEKEMLTTIHEHMRNVHANTIAVLFNGSKQEFVERIRTESKIKPNVSNNGLNQTHYRQTCLTRQGQLQPRFTACPIASSTSELCTSCQKQIDHKMMSLQCNFCDKPTCSMCLQTCSECQGQFCQLCAIISYKCQNESSICLSCLRK